MSTPDGGPAFPVAAGNSTDYEVLQEGMSLRDWFAGMALQGLLAIDWGNLEKNLVAIAFRYADAMLKEREH